jgi:hypothetical protein
MSLTAANPRAMIDVGSARSVYERDHQLRALFQRCAWQ